MGKKGYMKYLPLFAHLKGRPCLVVGGGKIAAHRARLLIKCHAKVTIVAPKISMSIQTLIYDKQADWLQAEFDDFHLIYQKLVIAATNSKVVNRLVYQQAKQHDILVNVADCPELCDFIVPSILDRSPVIIAVSSGGHSPTLSRQLRSRLETLIPVSYGRLAKLIGRYRETVKAKFSKLSMRRRFWEAILQGPVVDHVLAGRDNLGERTLRAILDGIRPDQLKQGEVYLVGAGPGDPELLTLKALKLMQQADVAIYDRLVSKEVLALVRKDAEYMYVGKQRTWHAVRQEQINQLLLEQAQQGKRVLRLKGGDPFIFGRGGEEIEILAAKNINFQIVPGITAASGCSAYAGIPLTHRYYSQSCIFVTGQLKNGTLGLNWSALVQPRQTVVVYMGLAGLSVLSRQLISHGMPADTPTALVQQATTQNQQIWVSSIGNLPELAEREQPVSPTLIIIGETVRFRVKHFLS